jgi:hypothetical protein
MAFLLPSLAEPDRVFAGPYNISFDLSIPKSSYNVTVVPPKELKDLRGDITISYLITIENKSGLETCWIGLSQSNSTLPKASPETLARTVKTSLEQDLHAFNIETEFRIIDGSDGAIAAGDKMLLGETIKVYNAMYNVKPEPSLRHLVCSIYSTYPWEVGTLPLLKTIHIEDNATIRGHLEIPSSKVLASSTIGTANIEATLPSSYTSSSPSVSSNI